MAEVMDAQSINACLRIPVKWATDSGKLWAKPGRASRRGKDIMTEVAHMGQEECETPHHLVSIISFPSSRFLVEFLKVGAIPVMWATPEWRICVQPAVESVRRPQRLIHSCSSAAAFRRT